MPAKTFLRLKGPQRGVSKHARRHCSQDRNAPPSLDTANTARTLDPLTIVVWQRIDLAGLISGQALTFSKFCDARHFAGHALVPRCEGTTTGTDNAVRPEPPEAAEAG